MHFKVYQNASSKDILHSINPDAKPFGAHHNPLLDHSLPKHVVKPYTLKNLFAKHLNASDKYKVNSTRILDNRIKSIAIYGEHNEI